MSEESRAFFLGIDQIDFAVTVLAEAQERASHLIKHVYAGRPVDQLSKEVVIRLMELMVSSEDFLVFVEELTESSDLVEKDKEFGIQITDKELEMLTLRSVACRDILQSLRERSIVLDILQ